MTAPSQRKIVSPELLAQELRQRRAAGRSIVQCHGCFDIVHPGHIRYLQFARQLGDVLVVSLTGDSNISKGPTRPYIPQELRAENLAALEFVDWVVIDPHPTACELLEQLRPAVYVKGREYAGSNDPRFLRETEIVERHGGRVVFHGGDVVFSSTRLIQTLQRDDHLDEVRLQTLCQRHDIDRRTIHATLERAAAARYVVVGDVFVDEYVLCEAAEAATDAPLVTLQKLGVQRFWAGAAAVAQQIAALGGTVTLVTNVRAEAKAGSELDSLEAAGVRIIAPVAEAAGLPTRTTFVSGDAKLLRAFDGGPQPLDSLRQREAAERIRAVTTAADVLVWCDEGLGFITPELVREIAASARTQPLRTVAAAAGARSNAMALIESHRYVLSERRLREALHDSASGAAALTWQLLQRSAGRAAMVRLDRRGWLCFDGRTALEEPLPERLRSEFVPSLAAHIADSIGVCDAAVAASALTLAADASLELGAYLSAALEALTSTRLGRNIVSMDELAAWLPLRPELRRPSRFMPDAASIPDLAAIAPPLASA